MPQLIRNLPFGPTRTGEVLALPDGTSLPVRRDAIIVWVSVTPIDQLALPPDSPRFPAVIDTGFNDSFLMQSAQLAAWGPAGIQFAIFRNGSALRVGGETIALWEATVWLHPNRPGSRDLDPSGAPFALELPNGIALAPAGSAAGRELPLIGLLAIRFSNLRIEIDGEREAVNVLVPTRPQPATSP